MCYICDLGIYVVCVGPGREQIGPTLWGTQCTCESALMIKMYTIVPFRTHRYKLFSACCHKLNAHDKFPEERGFKIFPLTARAQGQGSQSQIESVLPPRRPRGGGSGGGGRGGDSTHATATKEGRRKKTPWVH